MYTRILSITRSRSASRSGIVIALVAVCLIVMLAMLSLALDVGWMMNTKEQLQAAADSAALAAVMDIGKSGPTQDEANARASVKKYLNLHRAGDQYADIDPASTSITLGISAFDDTHKVWSYTPKDPGFLGRDSVQVTVRRSDTETAANRKALPLFFAGVLGRTRANISASATAQLTARDISVCQDVSGSMVFDSSFTRFDTHMSEGGSGLVPGASINNADVYYAYSGNATTRHIQTRMEATGKMYSNSPVSASGYSVYMPPQDGKPSAAYSDYAVKDANGNDQGMKLGIIGTSVLPYGDPAVVDSYDPQLDPGLVFIPRGTYSLITRGNQGVPTGQQMVADNESETIGNLWGIQVSSTVNPAWGNADPNQGETKGIENDLRTRRQYSMEEIYCLRNPQDPNYTTLSPRNPQYDAPNGTNVAAATTSQEGSTTSRWQLRSMVILDIAKWKSGLINPLWSLPPATPPANAALLSTTGSAFTNASWLAEAENSANPSQNNMSLRISRAQGGITSYMDLPQGKRYVTGNQPEWAFYEISGEDGFRSGSAYHDWSNCVTIYSTGTPTQGTFTLTANVNGTNRTTVSITRNATAATIQTALGNLSGVGAANVLCTGGPVNTTPVGVYFRYGTINILGLTCTKTSYNSGAAPNVLFNQSYDDYTSQHGTDTYAIKTAATSGGNGVSTTTDWHGADGVPYTADDQIYGVAYYDPFNTGYQPGYRLAKAWSLARLRSNSTPAAPQSGSADWKWLVAPHAFSSDALYQYHFWEHDASLSLPTTAIGDNDCADSGEVIWPGTGPSLDGRTVSAGLVSGNYTSGTPGKLNERLLLDDLSGSTKLSAYFNWVANPNNGGDKYPGRSRLLQWRFGPKTLTEAMVMANPTINNSKYQYYPPILPLHAGRDAIFAFAQYEYQMAQNQDPYAQDYVSMAIFGTNAPTSALIVPLTNQYDNLWDQTKLSPNSFTTQQNGQNSGVTNIIPNMCLQANHWSGSTSIGGGLRRAFSAIDKQRTGNTLRQNSKPTLLLVTDGRTNIWYNRSDLTNATGYSAYNTSGESGVGGRNSLTKDSNGVEMYDGPSWDIDSTGALVQNPPASNPANWNSYNSWFTPAMQNDPYDTAVSSGADNASDLLTREDVWYLARQRSVTFHVVLIGTDADPFLGNWIASVSGGICIWANGTPAEYVPILQAAFRTLAAFKPVQLIQ